MQQLTRQQQQFFAQQLNDQLERMTMSWDNELKAWYPTALAALEFSSASSLQIPPKKFIGLFNQERQGLNMNVVAVLCNNIELRTPREMEVTAKDWAQFLEVNARIGERWNALVDPLRTKLLKELEIMNNKPKLVTMGEA